MPKVYFLLLASLLITPLFSAEIERLESVHIIYLDPDLTTYDAVSRESLIYSRPCIVSLPPKNVIADIQNLAESAGYGPFDDAQVRIKIDGTLKGPIYFDSKGGAFIEGLGVSKQLSEDAFKELKKLFTPLRKSSGCQSMGRWPTE